MVSNTDTWRPNLDRFQRLALIVGVVGAVLSGAGAALGVAQFFYSLTFAFFFWLILTIGATILLMIQHLTGGVWGLMIRRMAESAALTLPVLAVVFVIMVVGMGYIYPWMNPQVVAESKVVQFKTALWLTQPFFIARAVIYFALWGVMAFLLNRWSSEQDATGEPGIARRLARLSGPGIPIVVLSFTLAATDWGMSLEPEWFSSMYPVIFIVEGMLATFAWSIIALTVMRSRKMLPYEVPIGRLHDLGKFMFAFVVLWTYTSFSQFLIIWSGNIAEETPFYVHRLNGGWQVLGVGLMLGHFFLPFFALMSRHAKRNFTAVTSIAAFIVFIQVVYVFWAITPAFFADRLHISPIDLTALLGVGGFWLALWARNLKQRPLLPPNDKRVSELMAQAAGEHGHGAAHPAPAHH